ncbi:MNIO family bufferin maturase [Herbaspirillum seropedicae]|uniref:MNIO family bufferin maturase n=1 Tax=Herbaspirillum seropedicae TaxID=964 RepID=UPI003FCE1734
MTAHLLSAGLGLKPQHFDAALDCSAPGLWFEVHPENYLMDGGPRLAWLQAIREHHPVALHGVSLSLAGPDAPDPLHLRQLAQLAARIEPVLVSEHLAWSRAGGHYLPDLLPVPRTIETLARLAANISRTQDVLKRRIALENPSHYLRMDQHSWSEPEFLQELVRRTGCGLLVDVNNVHVSACNLGMNARQYLDQLPVDDILEIHLAGHSADASLPGLLVDSHDAPIAAPVWALYQHLLARTGARPTLIERDGNVPTFEELLAERDTAATLLQETAAAPQEQIA